MKTIFLKGLCGLSLVMIPEAVFASSANNLKSVSPHQYTHLIETYQSQTFEPLSQTALFSEQSASVSSFPKMAKVYFISKDGEQVFGSAGGNNTFEDPTIKQCIGDGYKYNATNCPNGLPADTCPYNTSYFKTCCDVAYNYTEENCSLLNKSSSCGNKYKCDCSEEKYPVTANSCTSPQIPTTESGASCTVNGQIRYTKCVCPIGVNASYGCETYYASPCNTVCKKAKSDNCDNRTAVQTPYGCEKYFTDCASKCEKAYSDNCRNRIAVSAPNGCEQYYADCSSKCEIAKADNCANRTAVSAPYGCKKYYADCSSKCEVAKEDECKKYTMTECPKNAKCEYVYTCSPSKIKSWSCDGKYFQDTLSNTCVEQLFLYGDGTLSENWVKQGRHAIGIVVDKKNRLAVAATDINEYGKSVSFTDSGSELSLSNEIHVPEDLEKCAEDDFDTCGADGKANTDIILACGEACNGTPAATACHLYEPEECTADFCKAGKWFLPSARELNIIQHLNLGAASSLLGGSLMSGTYWSSTRFGEKDFWGNYRDSYKDSYAVWTRGTTLGFMSYSVAKKEHVRPVVKY